MPDSYSQPGEPFPLSQGVSTFNEAQEDSTNKMWSAYMMESGEYDKRVTDVWRKDTSDILIFAVVFSATVAVVSLKAIKSCLPILAIISLSPTTIVCVNTVWALSLVLSLTSALLAILIQQWMRRYNELPLLPRLSSERARVRSYLFLGTLNFGIHHAVEAAPMLLHLSVFLFLTGLVMFFFIVNKTVAIVLSIFVGINGMAYFTLSILPCLYRNCPYGTPVSSILCCLWHASAFFAAFCLRWILRRFHALLVPSNPGDVESGKQGKLTHWLNSTDNSLDKHGKYLKNGYRFSIIQGALEAPVVVDVKALAWLLELPAMAEKGKIQDFIVNTPGDLLAQLMSVPIESGRIVFRDHLLSLLRSCAANTVELDEHARRRRLLVCLDAILRIVKASGDPYGVSPSQSVLNDIRTNFANIHFMRPLWADTDPHVRIVSRSICALLARHLVRKQPLEEPELAWLQEVMGKSSNTIFNSLDDISKADSMNFDSYIYGVLGNQMVDPPAKAATFFMEMVATLASSESQAAFRRSVLERRISESSLMRRAGEQEPNQTR
ncbi:hypothetical protein BGY98DRAFT_1097873 [Russula aff. rugulosa BPL654]|nr:hypothetical protein BGY98DRAFT_1097873 [Russula aff. rugulosa BPL654]